MGKGLQFERKISPKVFKVFKVSTFLFLHKKSHGSLWVSVRNGFVGAGGEPNEIRQPMENRT